MAHDRRCAAWLAVVLILASLSLRARADGQQRLATPTPNPPLPRALGTSTPTSTFTPTSTPPSCVGESLSVNSVQSPTNALTQTITGCRNSYYSYPSPCDTVVVSSETGSVDATTTYDSSCGFQALGFTATIDLVPNSVNHIQVCVQYCDCPQPRCTSQPITITQGVVGPDVPLTGKKLLVKDHDGDATKRKLVVISKDPAISPPPSDLDPGAPTNVGGSLRVFNPSTGEAAFVPLPATGWTGLGKPAGSKGYKYTGGGACKPVLIKRGKLLKAVCHGDQIDFTLDEQTQGTLAVTLGAGATQHCLLFGGTVKESPATFGSGKIGQFKALDAPAPSACP